MRLDLSERDVHVWTLDDVALEHPLLSDDEQERAARYRREIDRQRFTARRTLLRRLCGAYTGLDPQAVRFRLTRFGRPLLENAPGLSFSVTQTDSVALLAFTREARIGIDAERIKPAGDFVALGREVFSEAEMQDLASAERFYKTWARKEALVKVLGTGLAGNPKRFTARDAGDGTWAVWRGDRRAFRNWMLRDLPTRPDVAAAVAVSLFKENFQFIGMDFLFRDSP